MNAQTKHTPDWYERREELRRGLVFQSVWGIVRLDRGVPGDGTKWYVDSWLNDHWSCEDGTIEPGDLIGEPIEDSPQAIAKAVTP